MVIISIEGNIGAGKSTFLKCLESHLSLRSFPKKEVVILQEDIDVYTKLNTVNPLAEFYKDKIGSALAFQLIATTAKINLLKEIYKKSPHAIIITERSILSDKLMFVDTLYDEGFFTELDYQAYMYYYKSISEHYFPTVSFSLEVDPLTCLERIRQRNRKGEEMITLGYLESLGKRMLEFPKIEVCKSQTDLMRELKKFLASL
jgi:deoxyadenosine/deoxycytidine kinase